MASSRSSIERFKSARTGAMASAFASRAINGAGLSNGDAVGTGAPTTEAASEAASKMRLACILSVFGGY